MTAPTTGDRIEAAIRRRSFRFTVEAELQAALEVAFANDGIAIAREYTLPAAGPTDVATTDGPPATRSRAQPSGDRPDFFAIADGVAVEVKVDGARSALVRQLWRYAAHPVVRELVLVSSVLYHVRGLPPTLGGKSLRAVKVGGLFG